MRLLIAHSSESFASALKENLQEEFDLRICSDGVTAQQLIDSFQPEAVIIDLMLPYLDSLTALRMSAHKPNIVLALSTYVTAYIEQAALRAGVGYIMLAPTVRAVIARLEDMLYSLSSTPTPQELRLVSSHMQKLGLSSSLDGYKQLRVCIPMYRRDPRQRMLKELYPAIAKTYGWHDPRKVEHSMRRAIQAAWKKRDSGVWSAYFTPNDNGDIPCPSNKQFISRIAELLEMA